MPDGDVVMLENVRFEPGETKNDPELAERYAALADAYVNDAFGAAHRAHASTEGVARLLPERRRAAAAARGRDAHRHPRRPRAPARRDRRRREGDRQDRRARGVPRARRHDPRSAARCASRSSRRQGHDGRRLAVRGGGHRARPRGPRRRGGRQAAAARPTWSLGDASSPRTPSAASSTASTCPTAGWASTSAADAPRRLRRGDRRARAPCSGTARWARSSSSRSRPGTRAVAEAVAAARGHDRRRRRRQRRGAGAVRARRRGDAPVDRRRRVAGADRGQDPPGVEVLSS